MKSTEKDTVGSCRIEVEKLRALERELAALRGANSTLSYRLDQEKTRSAELDQRLRRLVGATAVYDVKAAFLACSFCIDRSVIERPGGNEFVREELGRRWEECMAKHFNF